MITMKKIFSLCLMSAIAFSAIAVEPYEIVNDNGYSYIKLTDDLASIGFEVTDRGNSSMTVGGILIDENGNSKDLGAISELKDYSSLAKDSSFKFYLADNGIANATTYSIVKTDDGKYRLTFNNSSSVGSSNANHGYSQGNHKGGGYGHNNGKGGNKGWGNGANMLDEHIDAMWIDFKINAIQYISDTPTGMPLPGFASALMMTLIASGAALILKRKKI